MDENLNFDTLAVRAGTLRSDFNEHSEATSPVPWSAMATMF